MLNKILCIVIGHRWTFPAKKIEGIELIEDYAICKRCLKVKKFMTEQTGTGMDVDPVAVNASKCKG